MGGCEMGDVNGLMMRRVNAMSTARLLELRIRKRIGRVEDFLMRGFRSLTHTL